MLTKFLSIYTLFPSSIEASILIAFTSPIPSICFKEFNVMSLRSVISLILDNIKFDMSFTDLFFVPVFNIILSNSSLEIFSLPYFFKRSLGLSYFWISFINVLSTL